MEKRALRVFLCYASPDKESVQQLYRRLTEDGVNVWLDVENLIPGQRWQIEIPHAIREAEVVIVCLSNKSINKEGYVQKEIAFALDKSDEKPDESIYIIPLRIEDCLVPERLHQWQWVDLFSEDGYIRLLNGLRKKAKENNATLSPSEATKIDEVKSVAFKREKFGNYSEALKLYRELERLAPQYPGLKQKIKELETNEKRQASEKKVSMGKRRLRKENSMVFGYLAIIFVFGLIVFGFFFEKFTLPQFVDLNATATFTSLALPTENLSPINLLKTSTPFIYVTKPPTSIVYPTITKTPYVTSTATSTLEPVSLILKTDGAVYKFAVVNLPPECIPSICEVRWQNFEGAWIDNKKENGPQQNSFTNLKYDSNWKKAFTANLELEIDINPKNPYIIIFKACIDELKTKCFTASAGNPN